MPGVLYLVAYFRGLGNLQGACNLTNRRHNTREAPSTVECPDIGNYEANERNCRPLRLPPRAMARLAYVGSYMARLSPITGLSRIRYLVPGGFRGRSNTGSSSTAPPGSTVLRHVGSCALRLLVYVDRPRLARCVCIHSRYVRFLCREQEYSKYYEYK